MTRLIVRPSSILQSKSYKLHSIFTNILEVPALAPAEFDSIKLLKMYEFFILHVLIMEPHKAFNWTACFCFRGEIRARYRIPLWGVKTPF